MKATVLPLMILGTDKRLYGVAWRPQGDYALAVGDDGNEGVVARYSYHGLGMVTTGGSRKYDGVTWKGDGSVSVIAGSGSIGKPVGAVLAFDGTAFKTLDAGQLPPEHIEKGYVKFGL